MMLLIVFFLVVLVVPAQAAVYWVAPTGNNASCATIAASGPTTTVAKTTIAAGIACMGPGDTLNIRAGTYAEGITESQFVGKSGSGTGNTYTSPTTIRAYGSEVVTLTGGRIEFGTVTGFNTSYIIFQGDATAKNFVLNGYRIGIGTSVSSGNKGSAHHIKFDGVTVTGVPGGPAGAGGNAGAIMVAETNTSANWFTNMHVYNNAQVNLSGPCNGGGPAPHGFYIEAASNIIENSEVDHNMGYGVQVYDQNSGSASSNTVRNNYVHHNGLIQPTICEQASYGITLSTGSGNVAYNNIIANNAGGIDLNSGAIAYNNTVYGNTNSFTSWCCYEAIHAQGGSIVRNNIVYGNQSGYNTIYNSGGTGTCAVGNGNVCTNPNFVNASPVVASDFRLQASSTAAIGAGITLPSCPGAGWCFDYAGLTRPQGGTWDAGAYEYTVPFTCPAVSPALVASYNFEGNGTDATGNGRTASLGSGWTYTAGHNGQGALSNGTSGITVADHDSLDPCAAFTYEGWINLANTTGNYVFITKNPNSKAYLFGSTYGYCGSGVPIGGYNEIGDTLACSTTALAPGFKHLAVTYDSTLPSANIKLYLNGIQVAYANGADLLTPTTGTLQFCQSSFGELCPSGTVIDEVRIYNYARSASEILSSVTVPPVFTIKLQVSSLKIGPSVNLKVGVP